MTFVIILFVICMTVGPLLIAHHYSIKKLKDMYNKTIKVDEQRIQTYKDYIVLLKIYKAVLEELIKDDYDISELPIPWTEEEKNDVRRNNKAN